MASRRSVSPTEARGRGRLPADEIGVIEAAYSLHGTEAEWLQGLALASAPLLDVGLGLAVTSVDLVPEGARMRDVACTGGPPSVRDAVCRFLTECTPSIIHTAFHLENSVPVRAFSSAVGGPQKVAEDPASEAMFRLGIRDAMGILGADGNHRVSISVWLPSSRGVDRRFVARWCRVASHLGAGFRLRRKLLGDRNGHPESPGLAEGDAVLTPDGGVRHAEASVGKGRGMLGRAVVAMERARGELRSENPDEALDAWRGLVAGQWSLVDQFDEEGERFLVARKNDPDVHPFAGLTQRERQVLSCRARGLPLKLISYELGFSNGAVSKSLSAGMGKLGIASDLELVALFAPTPHASAK